MAVVPLPAKHGCFDKKGNTNYLYLGYLVYLPLSAHLTFSRVFVCEFEEGGGCMVSHNTSDMCALTGWTLFVCVFEHPRLAY